MKRALLWAACLAACAVPDLDRAGNIRCGVATEPNGGCPDGYACNADRCCPVGSTGCPMLPAACEGHRVAAYPASTPPAQCATPGTIGRPCARITECATGLVCPDAATLPGGYCTTAGCAVATAAGRAARAQCEGGGGVCVTGAGLGALGTCMMRCSLPAGETFGRCRADQVGKYICARVTNAQINETLCLPDCEALPALCTNGARCDLRTHLCVGGAGS